MQKVELHTKVCSEQVSPAFGNTLLAPVPLSVVFNEDCMVGLKRFADNYFDLAIVDPPYGIGAENHAGNADNGWKQWEKKVGITQYQHPNILSNFLG